MARGQNKSRDPFYSAGRARHGAKSVCKACKVPAPASGGYASPPRARVPQGHPVVCTGGCGHPEPTGTRSSAVRSPRRQECIGEKQSDLQFSCRQRLPRSHTVCSGPTTLTQGQCTPLAGHNQRREVRSGRIRAPYHPFRIFGLVRGLANRWAGVARARGGFSSAPRFMVLQSRATMCTDGRSHFWPTARRHSARRTAIASRLLQKSSYSPAVWAAIGIGTQMRATRLPSRVPPAHVSTKPSTTGSIGCLGPALVLNAFTYTKANLLFYSPSPPLQRATAGNTMHNHVVPKLPQVHHGTL